MIVAAAYLLLWLSRDQPVTVIPYSSMQECEIAVKTINKNYSPECILGSNR